MKGPDIMELKTDKDFMEILRSHGLQVTYQRLAIYKALYLAGGHPSTEAIHQLVLEQFPGLALGTVYKTLEKFCEVGLIQKVGPFTEVARYDAKPGLHHYMICMGCQSIQNADSIVGKPDDSASGNNKGFHSVRRQVFLYGYCPNCQGSAADSQS